MLGGQTETLFYIVKTDDEKYSVFSMITDKIILNDVNKKEVKKFLETNNPMHPSLVFSNPGDGLGISISNPIISPMKKDIYKLPYKFGYGWDVSKQNDLDDLSFEVMLDDAYNSVSEFDFSYTDWRCEWSPPENLYPLYEELEGAVLEEKDNLINFVKRKRVKKNKNEDDEKK